MISQITLDGQVAYSPPPKTIIRITFIQEPDEWPDLTFLGQIVDEPTEDSIPLDKYRENTRHFQPAMPEYGQEDFERWMDYGKTWWMTCLRTVAKISVRGYHQTIRTEGVYNIESDIDRSEMLATWNDELEVLWDLLKDLGFTDKQIDSAPKVYA